MQVYCLHHQNTGFLGQLLTNILNGDSEVLRVVVPRGSLVLNKREASLFGDNIQCIVTTSKGCTLLTNSPGLATSDRKIVECSIKTPTQSLPIRQLANLCLDKHNRSSHQFNIDVALDGCSVSIKPDKQAGLLFTFKRPNGELVRSSAWAEADVFDGDATLKSFSSRVKTDAFEKEVVVKMDTIEILREVSKYLGKTLVLFNLDPTGEYTGVGISSSGVCALGRNGRGDCTAFSVPPSKLKIPKGCFLFATDAGVRELTRGYPLFSLKEVGFAR